MKNTIKFIIIGMLLLSTGLVFAENLTNEISSETEVIVLTNNSSEAEMDASLNETAQNVSNQSIEIEMISVFEQSLEEYDVLDKMPKDVVVLVQFYDVDENDSKVIVKNITAPKDASDEFDIIIMVPAKYDNMSICDAGRQIRENREIVVETEMSFWELFWKFRHFDELRNCIFEDY